jgi:hypothetical protein
MRRTIQALDYQSLDLNITKMTSVVFGKQSIDTPRFLFLAKRVFHRTRPDIVHHRAEYAFGANLEVRETSQSVF